MSLNLTLLMAAKSMQYFFSHNLNNIGETPRCMLQLFTILFESLPLIINV